MKRITVTTNLPGGWTTTNIPTWVTFNPATGDITVGQNPGTSNRSTTFWVRAADSATFGTTYDKQVSVFQSGVTWNSSVGSGGGTAYFMFGGHVFDSIVNSLTSETHTLTSDVEFTFTAPSWINCQITNQGSNQYRISITSNEFASEGGLSNRRSGKIVIMPKQSGLSPIVINVYQAARPGLFVADNSSNGLVAMSRNGYPTVEAGPSGWAITSQWTVSHGGQTWYLTEVRGRGAGWIFVSGDGSHRTGVNNSAQILYVPAQTSGNVHVWTNGGNDGQWPQP